MSTFSAICGRWSTCRRTRKERALANARIELANLAWVQMNAMRSVDNLVLDDRDLAVREVGLFKNAGGGTLVDVTTPDFGRDPLALKEVVGAIRHPRRDGRRLLPRHVPSPRHGRQEARTAIADEIIADVEEGVGGSRRQAPASSAKSAAHGRCGPNEAKVLRASAPPSARPARRSPSIPAATSNSPFQILDVLERAGADIEPGGDGAHGTHPTCRPPRLREFARIGCYLEYDWFGEVRPTFPYGRKDQYIVDKQFVVDVPSDGERLKTLACADRRGLSSTRILVSQDVCFKTRLAAYGGVGYAHIAKYVRRWMPEMGIGPGGDRDDPLRQPASRASIRLMAI